MIIVQLSGGFGNQLFQYAAGFSLAMHHDTEVKVDISGLNAKDVITGTFREYDINKLENPPEGATEKEIEAMISLPTLKNVLEKGKPFYKRKVYKEKSNKFDSNFFKAGNNILLKGNRQSEKYFRKYEEKLKKYFSISEMFINSVKGYGESLSNQSSIAIHIRRGDYLTPIAMEWLGILPISYYEQAIDYMASKIGNSKFYIFSDDIDWVKGNLKINFPHEFVSGIITKSAIEDFYLMSKCSHNIIANSTFSWWAAWLNFNPEKIVIAPKNWYNQIKLDTSDLIPESWVRI